MHGQLTTVEFESAKQRDEALGLIGGTMQRVRSMRGFQAAYYLDVNALRIIVVTIFDSEEDLEAIQLEDDALKDRVQEIGVKYLGTDRYPVIAFAEAGAP